MVTATTLGSLRKERVLVSYDADGAQLSALLPCSEGDRRSACQVLEAFGFRPQGTPVYWTRNAALRELGRLCAGLAAELGRAAIWDVGPVFALPERTLSTRVSQLPADWSRDFVLHVRGTPRCLMFDREARAHEMQAAYDAEWGSYLAGEFVGTE